MRTNRRSDIRTGAAPGRTRRGIAAICTVVAMMATPLGVGAVAFRASVASAAPNNPATLTGESLQTSHGTGSTSGADFTCASVDNGAALTFSVSGTASGPYPGTFTENGRITQKTLQFQASFTITSGDVTVMGTKTSGVEGYSCNDLFDATAGHMPYTSTITTPTGIYSDSGAANTQAYVGQTSFFTIDFTPNGIPNLCVSPGTTNLVPCPYGTTAVVAEQFQSNQAQTTLVSSCTRSITGTHTGALVVPAGTTLCLVNATQNGAVIVRQGGWLVATNSRITGTVTADHPAGIQLCGNDIRGSVSVHHATGFVLVGDPANGCVGNTIAGSLILQNNTGGLVDQGNRVAGSTIVSGNSGTPGSKLSFSR